jgi:hypothetical protein
LFNILTVATFDFVVLQQDKSVAVFTGIWAWQPFTTIKNNKLRLQLLNDVISGAVKIKDFRRVCELR